MRWKQTVGGSGAHGGLGSDLNSGIEGYSVSGSTCNLYGVLAWENGRLDRVIIHEFYATCVRLIPHLLMSNGSSTI